MKVYAIILHDYDNKDKGFYQIYKTFKTRELAVKFLFDNNFNNDQLLELDVIENYD